MAKLVTTKGYCVVEVGWEYNDEYYYRADSGGGTPKKVYLNPAAAQIEVERLNRIHADEYMTDEQDRPCTRFEIVEIEVA